jgi:lipopolysaccharide/colanic/teichoic acid biosynthesis glycosyltransferase
MTRRPYDPVKRCLDIVAGSLALLVSLPVQAVVAVLVLVRLGRPVLFRQERPGKDGVIFQLVKFRTMREPEPGAQGHTDAERLTDFGRRLRSTSFDELPTLRHVVSGKMSLVGPRPLHVRYLPRYSREQARRHEVRPGVTGLAQVSGRNLLDWDDRLRLDVEYVDRRSFLLDARIVAQTVAIVVRGTGISAEGHATVAEFRGSGEQGAADA